MSIMLPYQQRWLADPNRVRVAEKSRRIGWSWMSAAETGLGAARANGQNAWYVGYNREMAKDYITDVAFHARVHDMVVSEIEEGRYEVEEGEAEVLTYNVHFNSGFSVSALSSRPTNLRAKRGHIVLDEAAHHPDLNGLLESAMAVLMWPGQSRVDIFSTHFGVENPFNVLVEEVRARKYPYSLHRTTFDEAIEQGLYQQMCRVSGKTWSVEAQEAYVKWVYSIYGDRADQELRCIPARSGGTYLQRDVIERQMRPGVVLRLNLEDGFAMKPEKEREARVQQWLDEAVRPFVERLPKDRQHFFGEDFGRTSDRTVIPVGYLAQDLTRRTPFAIELLNVPYEQQRQILFYVVDRLPNFFKGALDATGNGGYLAEVAQQRYGESRIEAVQLTSKWYSENLPPFKAALEDGELELVRDADHLLDLHAFKIVNGLPVLPKAKTATTGEGPARHGDAGIAYALLHYASRQPIVEYAYQAAPAARGTFDPIRRSGSGFRTHRGGLS